jgi:hypothetical protein
MANALRSPAFDLGLQFLEKHKRWQNVGMSPLKTPDQSLDAFVVLNNRNKDGLGNAFDVRSSENAVNDFVFIYENYQLVVVNLYQPAKRQLTGLLLIPRAYR